MTLWDGTTAEGTYLSINANTSVEDAYIGCSIAVNGVCLTATEIIDQKVDFRFIISLVII